MKTRYFILGAALCGTMGLGLTSCNNDKFLEVTHYSLLSSDALYENDANAIKGMTGCYDQPDSGTAPSQAAGQLLRSP